MKNLLAEDRSVCEVCEEVLRGSYPNIAKQLALQLLLALKEIHEMDNNSHIGDFKECPKCISAERVRQ